MKYAVVKIKGQQHRVSEGDEILVDKLGTDKPEIKVFLVVDEKNVKIGTPEVKDAKIKIKILEEEEKGKKLYVQTFKAKSRYRRKIGFRPLYSRLLIEKIT